MSNTESSNKGSTASNRAVGISAGLAVSAISMVVAFGLVLYGFSHYAPGAVECLSGSPQSAPSYCKVPLDFVSIAALVGLGGWRLAAYLWTRR